MQELVPAAVAAEEGGEGANGDLRGTANGAGDEGEEERTLHAGAGDGSGRDDPWMESEESEI